MEENITQDTKAHKLFFCLRNQTNIPTNRQMRKSNFERSKVLMLGLHSEYSNYRDNFAEGTLKFVRIIEVFELQRFE